MSEEQTRRATVYFDSPLHTALTRKAALSHRWISDLVNAAVRMSLSEDEEDLAAFAVRVTEREMSHEALLKDLKAHGKL